MLFLGRRRRYFARRHKDRCVREALGTSTLFHFWQLPGREAREPRSLEKASDLPVDSKTQPQEPKQTQEAKTNTRETEMSDQAEGWHTDASGLRVKKWDPHRETRRRGYERQLQQHQVRRLEGAPRACPAGSRRRTTASRPRAAAPGAAGAAARSRAAASRGAGPTS